MILQHAIRTLQFSIVYVALLFISVSLYGQQTGEVSYEQLGVSFSIPEGWFTAAHVPIGYPVGGGHGPISRKPLEQLLSWDQFG